MYCRYRKKILTEARVDIFRRSIVEHVLIVFSRKFDISIFKEKWPYFIKFMSSNNFFMVFSHRDIDFLTYQNALLLEKIIFYIFFWPFRDFREKFQLLMEPITTF